MYLYWFYNEFVYTHYNTLQRGKQYTYIHIYFYYKTKTNIHFI